MPVLSVPGTAALSESLWQQVASLVAPPTPPRGRPSGDLRRQVEGMLAVMHTGVPWREVPSAGGSWQTTYARYRSWVKTGVWDRIAAILHPDQSADEPAAPP
jgi:transposase